MTELERQLRPLLMPVLGGYLRPWMTLSEDPESCKVWVVGANPAKPFPIERIGSFEAYADALFNRNGSSLRELYDDITGGRPSPTRRNLDRVREALESNGIRDVLETNINCFPTRMSADLQASSNREGRDRGEAIFDLLLATGQPKVVWLHGVGAANKFRSRYEPELPDSLTPRERFKCKEIGERLYVLTQSLAPPAFNRWQRDFDDVLSQAAKTIALRAQL